MADKEVMLITGSSGRVGQALINRFKDRYQIVGFDRHIKDTPGVDHVKMDVTSDESVSEAMEYVKDKYGTKIGPVFHLAAYYSFSGEKPELYDIITVNGTRRFLKALQPFDVFQFHFASTLLVYQPCGLNEKITEKSPVDPRWDYPKSKVKTERVMREERGNIPIVVMRIAGCYDDLCHSIPIGHNIQRIYEHQVDSHLFPGNARHGNPFLHFEDLMDAYECCLKKRDSLPSEFVVNISEDKTIAYSDLQNQISEILEHKDFELFRVPKWLAKAGAWVEDEIPGFDSFVQPWMIDIADDHYAVDISLAKETLGWTPKHFIGSSLPVMMELLKTDPVRWYEIQGFEMPEHIRKHILEQKAHAG